MITLDPRLRDLEGAAALLDAHPDYRVIRTLPALDTLILPTPEGKIRTALVIDTETTNLDWQTGKIIQIAACPVRFDARARIIGIGRTQSWVQDPGEPLLPEIQRLTGLADADLAGRAIDDASVTRLLDDADLLIAHNAAFDRPWWEARYATCRAKPWACSLKEVDWRGHGFEGRSLAALLGEVGWFNARHRADADVDALVALLTATLPPGHRVAAELIFTARKPKMRFSACQAPFESKDALRLRGYRWHAPTRVWRCEVANDRCDAEFAWLRAEAGCHAPKVETITWFDRHR